MAGASHDSRLPEYSVRVSARARHVRLTVSAREGLVVVVPRGVKVDTDALVASKEAWAKRSLSRVAERRDQFLGGAEALLPSTIELRSCGRELAVEYGAAAARRPTVVERGDVLIVTGDDAHARLEALRRWLDRTARASLPPRLAHLAHEHELPYARCRITKAKSRWGSCSVRSTISLNRMLVFLPPHLVDALILHELAHTRALDHSPRFWSFLTTLDPAALAHRAQLRRAGELVPAWADV